MSIGADPNPVSISFTEAPLSLHSDEPYLENTAKLLVLHCLRCMSGAHNHYNTSRNLSTYPDYIISLCVSAEGVIIWVYVCA